MSIKLRREQVEFEKQKAAERVKEEKRRAQILRQIEEDIKVKEAEIQKEKMQKLREAYLRSERQEAFQKQRIAMKKLQEKEVIKEEISENFSKNYKQSLERIAFAQSKIKQRKLEEAHILLKKQDNAANMDNRKLFQQIERVEQELNKINETVDGTSKQILKQNMQASGRQKNNTLADYGIVLPEKRGGKAQIKGLVYPMIDDKLYEEHEKITFKPGVSPHWRPSETEDRQNVTRQRDPAYDEQENKSKIKLRPVAKEMQVKKNDTYNLAQELKKKKILEFFKERKIQVADQNNTQNYYGPRLARSKTRKIQDNSNSPRLSPAAGSYAQSPMPLQGYSKDMISSFNSNFTPGYRDSIIDPKQFEIMNPNNVRLAKVDGRVEGQPRYAIKRVSGRTDQDSIRSESILRNKVSSPKARGDNFKLPDIRQGDAYTSPRSQGFVSPKTSKKLQEIKQYEGPNKQSQMNLDHFNKKYLPKIQKHAENRASISPQHKLSKSVDSMAPQEHSIEEKLQITEDDYLELFDSKNLKLGQFQGFNVSVEYMKERKKAQRKKNYWKMRVKGDFLPKKDDNKEFQAKIKIEEEKLKGLKLENNERIPLEKLIEQKKQKARKGSPASTAVTRSVKSEIKSTNSGLK